MTFLKFLLATNRSTDYGTEQTSIPVSGDLRQMHPRLTHLLRGPDGPSAVLVRPHALLANDQNVAPDLAGVGAEFVDQTGLWVNTENLMIG